MRKTLCTGIALTIAASVASAAQARQPSPIQRIIAQEDANSLTVKRRQAQRALSDPRSPDRRDPALAGHPQGMASFLDGRSPDTRDAGQEAQALLATPVEGRSPSTREAARTAHAIPAPLVVTVAAGGFDWGDAGIGAAAVFALALLGAGLVVLVRDSRRQKAQG
jgi:hypothetical protein